MHTREEVMAFLAANLVEMFELEKAAITPEARLYEDLDIDSIDAVDLIIKMRSLTGTKVDPELFKSVRTIGDVVGVIEQIQRKGDGS